MKAPPLFRQVCFSLLFLSQSEVTYGKSLPLITPGILPPVEYPKIQRVPVFVQIGVPGLGLHLGVSQRVKLGLGFSENLTQYKEMGRPKRQSLWSRSLRTAVTWHQDGTQRNGFYLKGSLDFETWSLRTNSPREAEEFIEGKKISFKMYSGRQWIWPSRFYVNIALGTGISRMDLGELPHGRDWDDFWLTETKEGRVEASPLEKPKFVIGRLNYEIVLGYTL